MIGQFTTQQINHTKGFVPDGKVGGEGSTNWSTSGEGAFVVTGKPGGPGFKAQKNTQTIFTDLDTISRFQAELIAEHMATQANARVAAGEETGCHGLTAPYGEQTVYKPERAIMRMRNTGRSLGLVAVACIAATASAQSPENFDVTGVGKDPRWKIAGRTASTVDVRGKHALKLSEGPGMGVVWLDGYDFGNGVIEVDLLGRSQPVQGSFVGVVFRAVDAQTHDAVYFRPFNFRASDADRHSHAVQYVSHPRWGWQPLRSERTGQYEKPVLPEPDGDEWFHVRVVVERPNVTVFVNGASAPCLAVQELSDRANGSVGLWVGEGSGGHFANLRVTRTR